MSKKYDRGWTSGFLMACGVILSGFLVVWNYETAMRCKAGEKALMIYKTEQDKVHDTMKYEIDSLGRQIRQLDKYVFEVTTKVEGKK